MGQTILCEYLAAWDEAGTQPDPVAFGFDDIRAMLDEAQEAMFSLGSSSNRNYETVRAQIKRIDDLKQENHELKQKLATYADLESQHLLHIDTQSQREQQP